jgi:hypothetical protein
MKYFSFSSGLAVLFGLLLTSFSQGEFIIGEFLAENSGISVTDEDGFPADWIEIRNTGTTAESLNGYSLTDAPLNPTKWTFRLRFEKRSGGCRVRAAHELFARYRW